VGCEVDEDEVDVGVKVGPEIRDKPDGGDEDRTEVVLFRRHGRGSFMW
jgi:hypothetical protein